MTDEFPPPPAGEPRPPASAWNQMQKRADELPEPEAFEVMLQRTRKNKADWKKELGKFGCSMFALPILVIAIVIGLGLLGLLIGVLGG